MYTPDITEFSNFSLYNLLNTCFGKSDHKLKACILIDLPEIDQLKNFSYLDNDDFQVQAYAKKHFYDRLVDGLAEELGFASVGFYAFKTTGGSNLDPEDPVTDPDGNLLSLEKDICPNHDLILAITDFSLTAPLTAMAKKYNFRGATLHGVNDVILGSGLAVDYTEISVQAECFRTVLDNADSFELNFDVFGENTPYLLNVRGKRHRKVMVCVLRVYQMLQIFQQVKFILFQLVLKDLSHLGSAMGRWLK